MAETQLHLEIIKNLDYSNASKDRLAQLINQRDQKVTSALVSFVQSRETAVSEQQKRNATMQLKSDLDFVLFGKSANDYAVTNATVTTTTTKTQQVYQSPASYTPLTAQQQPQFTMTTTQYSPAPVQTTTQYSYQPTQSTLNTTNYTQQPLTSYTYSNGSNTNSAVNLSAPVQQQSQVKPPSDDYMKNLLAQSNNAPAPVPQLRDLHSAQGSEYSGDETVKRAVRKAQATEFELDQRIQGIRSQKKAKVNQVLNVDANQIKKEQMRLASFKQLWVRGQPLVPELYKLFYDAVDDLDFASFLSLRHELHLDEVSVKDLIIHQREILRSSNGSITGINPEQFVSLMDSKGLQDDDIFSLLQIFFYLDFNNNGLLDADEILLGFVMLASASEKEKIEAAFLIVDEDGSGTLDINEVTKYMRSVIRMGDGRKFKSDDAFEHEFLIEKMAAATAKVIFKEMDLDNNGRISYEEFVVWHNLHGIEVEGFKEEKEKVKDILKAASKERSEKLMRYNAFTLQNKDYQELTNQRLKSVLDSKINDKSVNQFRERLQLGQVRFLDAVRFLKEHKVSERLGFGAFVSFMKELYQKCNVKVDLNAAQQTLNEFYQAIDLDSNGFIDWNEILGAFSLLCIGTENEKIRGVFEVFDMNGDNVLQFNEVYTLFLSSFNLIFMRNPESEIARQDPKKLSFSMAISAFSDNELDPYTNGLDYDTFVKWYRNFDLI